MASARSYIRLTKVREWSNLPFLRARPEDRPDATKIGAPGYHIHEGYVIDGWFLAEPRVGQKMVLLRFRRNGVERLGIFTSSLVMFVGESEIHTVNSIYRIEHCSFE